MKGEVIYSDNSFKSIYVYPDRGGYDFKSPTIASATPVVFNGSWYAAKEDTVPWKSAAVSGYAPTLTVYFDKAKISEIYNEDPDGCKYITVITDGNLTLIYQGFTFYILTSSVLKLSGSYPRITFTQSLVEGVVYGGETGDHPLIMLAVTDSESVSYGTRAILIPDSNSPGPIDFNAWFLGFSGTAATSVIDTAGGSQGGIAIFVSSIVDLYNGTITTN